MASFLKLIFLAAVEKKLCILGPYLGRVLARAGERNADGSKSQLHRHYALLRVALGPLGLSESQRTTTDSVV